MTSKNDHNVATGDSQAPFVKNNSHDTNSMNNSNDMCSNRICDNVQGTSRRAPSVSGLTAQGGPPLPRRGPGARLRSQSPSTVSHAIHHS